MRGGAAADGAGDDGGGGDGEGRRTGADVELAQPEHECVAHAVGEPIAYLERRVPGAAAGRVPDLLLQVSGGILCPFFLA